MRDSVQKGGSAAFPQHARDTLEVRAHPEEPHDERCMGNQMSGGDDAAHGYSAVGTGFVKHISGHAGDRELTPATFASSLQK